MLVVTGVLGGGAWVLGGGARVLGGGAWVLGGGARVLGGGAKVLGGGARVLGSGAWEKDILCYARRHPRIHWTDSQIQLLKQSLLRKS